MLLLYIFHFTFKYSSLCILESPLVFLLSFFCLYTFRMNVRSGISMLGLRLMFRFWFSHLNTIPSSTTKCILGFKSCWSEFKSYLQTLLVGVANLPLLPHSRTPSPLSLQIQVHDQVEIRFRFKVKVSLRVSLRSRSRFRFAFMTDFNFFPNHFFFLRYYFCPAVSASFVIQMPTATQGMRIRLIKTVTSSTLSQCTTCYLQEYGIAHPNTETPANTTLPSSNPASEPGASTACAAPGGPWTALKRLDGSVFALRKECGEQPSRQEQGQPTREQQ